MSLMGPDGATVLYFLLGMWCACKSQVVLLSIGCKFYQGHSRTSSILESAIDNANLVAKLEESKRTAGLSVSDSKHIPSGIC